MAHPRQKKTRPLTIKEHAVVASKLEGKETQTAAGMRIFNTNNPVNAANIVSKTLAREVVKTEIENRLAAQNINIDNHLKNIDNLAFNSDKDDIKLRASQDLADRAGVHHKYKADEDSEKDLNNLLPEADFAMIIGKYKKRKNIV